MQDVTPQDAMVYLMVVMSAVDSSMSDKELRKIGTLVQTLPVFEKYDEERLIECSRQCQKILAGDDGLYKIIDLAEAIIPRRLHDTAYACAVEIAAVDLHVEQEELRLLQILRQRLSIDRLAAAAIERGAQARYRTA